MTTAEPLSPGSLAARLGGAAVAHDYGSPGDPVTVLMAAGRRVSLTLDGLRVDGEPVTAEALAELAAAAAPHRAYGWGLDRSDMTVRGPCPVCGGPTACGGRERDPRSGRWHDQRETPTPCLRCRVAAALGQAPPGPAVPDPASSQPTPAVTAGTGPGPARAWTVAGHALALAAGTLTVDGRQVAADVAPADIVIYARRLYVGGRPVADLAA